MKLMTRISMGGLTLVLVLGLGAVRPALGAAKGMTLMTGLEAHYFTRTVTWEGDDATSKISGPVIVVCQDFRFNERLTVSVSAGASLSGFDGLVFRRLPISLDYGSGTMRGLAFGAEIRSRILKSGDFEVRGVGRIASVFGLARTWLLEGFAVPGKTRGRVNGMEVSFGPEVSYLFFGKFVPSIEVAARWLWADFKMDQTLEDLTGKETKRVRADLALSAFLGAEYRLSERLTLTAGAGILPYSGGVDGMASAGGRYRF